MQKVEQLNLLSKVGLLIIILLLSGCAKNAPSLPKDYSSVDSKNKLSKDDFTSKLLQLDCQEIKVQLEQLDKINETNISKIKSTRVKDQTIGYISTVLFPPLWFAIDNHTDEKSKIDEVYKQKDNLFKLQAYKKCKI
ncbi:hypothetical protein CP985_08950 [Malaciobacter mytili LMG 24559]|uniref:Lipoprotein n=1 Tax=Malaciobacter mytili LMG 24559 TaxID=1032238 RepID=A0AAX2AEM0_9BACT|nr:hypothetical protein [Malaciobacter mytili]AXH15352.1 hypothetical protein AMYT_1781 [Malaciobacter mytili LMG 24559]RXK15368.1 hypothetical protein CP985_08950 [Malaciobacter mytili LMG 24559]